MKTNDAEGVIEVPAAGSIRVCRGCRLLARRGTNCRDSWERSFFGDVGDTEKRTFERNVVQELLAMATIMIVGKNNGHVVHYV